MEEKKCKYCAMMIPKEAKICPHCRKKQGMSAGMAILLLVGIVFAIGIIANLSDKDNKPQSTAKTAPAATPASVDIEPVLELQSWSWRDEHGYAIAEGTVKNISSKPIDNVVAFMLTYDKDGTFIKSDRALIDYRPILPGQTSPFKVMSSFNPAMEKAVVTFKTFSGGTLPWKSKDKK